MRRHLSLVGVLGVVLLAIVYGALGVPLTLGNTGPADTGSLADTPEGANSTTGSSTTTTPSNSTTTTTSTDTETTTTTSGTTSSGDTATSTTDDPATTPTADETTTRRTTTATQTASSSSAASSQADDTAETTTTSSSAPAGGSDQSGDGSNGSSDAESDTDGDAAASGEPNVSFPSCTEVRIDGLEDSEWELEYVSLRVWLLDDWTRDGPPPIDTHMIGLPQNDTGPVYTYANDSLVGGDLYIVEEVMLVSPDGDRVEWSNPHDCEFVVGVSDNGTVSQPRDDT